LKGNDYVALNIIDFIDGVRKALEKIMKVEFKRIADRAMPPIEGDADGAIEFIDETKLEYELAVSLLDETTRSGYERVKKVDKRSASMAIGTTNHTKTKVRSMLTMNRPKVESFSEEFYCLPVGTLHVMELLLEYLICKVSKEEIKSKKTSMVPIIITKLN